jgi:23S rRNA pseudouridine2605 synthase
MFRHLGFLVEKLKRVQVGNLSLGSLKPGEFRYLDSEEIERFKRTLVAPARSRREKNA